jgi:hypothetical protein
MGTDAPRAGWDLFLFGVPLIGMLIFGFFRLDEVFTRKKGTPVARPSPVPQRSKRIVGTDPDGRAWDETPSSNE